MHRKKRFTSFPSPAGMSLTKLPLGRNNSVITSLFPPRESLVVTFRLGTGNSRTFFLRCGCRLNDMAKEMKLRIIFCTSCMGYSQIRGSPLYRELLTARIQFHHSKSYVRQISSLILLLSQFSVVRKIIYICETFEGYLKELP
jgi:hypothetical protein